MYLHILSADLLKSARDLEFDCQLSHRKDFDNATGKKQRGLIDNLIMESRERMVAYDVLINFKINNPS